MAGRAARITPCIDKGFDGGDKVGWHLRVEAKVEHLPECVLGGKCHVLSVPVCHHFAVLVLLETLVPL